MSITRGGDNRPTAAIFVLERLTLWDVILSNAKDPSTTDRVRWLSGTLTMNGILGKGMASAVPLASIKTRASAP